MDFIPAKITYLPKEEAERMLNWSHQDLLDAIYREGLEGPAGFPVYDGKPTLWYDEKNNQMVEIGTKVKEKSKKKRAKKKKNFGKNKKRKKK